MEAKRLRELLVGVAEGRLTPEDAADRLKRLPFDDIGFAKLDTHRELRTGRGEVIFGIGKTPEQVAVILKRLSENAPLVIATKVGPEYHAAAKAKLAEGLSYFEQARLLVYRKPAEGGKDRGHGQAGRHPERSEGSHGSGDGDSSASPQNDTVVSPQNGGETAGRVAETSGAEARETAGRVAVVCAGTADIPIAEEAAVTSELYGVAVDRYFDVGVAGIHRLLDKAEDIRKARVVVVVAGMEGALASVVGGLVETPVIAVPTSIGYGASMGGLAALLAMLNSCSLGVSVVNIDNGFGAGYTASLIVKGKAD